MKQKKIFFNKTDIASICGIDARNLESFLSHEVKKEVNFTKGRVKLKDLEVFKILKDIYPLKSDTEIKNLIKY